MEKINFCIICGGEVQYKVPSDEQHDDNNQHLRAVCCKCGFVNYQNPRIVVCAIATNQKNEILLAKRDIEPRRDFWTLPGGFLELDECPEEGAKREVEEETKCKVDITRAFAMITTINGEQVHIFYLANINHFSNTPTHESNEVKMVAIDNIPWDDLAFKTVINALLLYQKYPQHPGVFCGRVSKNGEFKLNIS